MTILNSGRVRTIAWITALLALLLRRCRPAAAPPTVPAAR